MSQPETPTYITPAAKEGKTFTNKDFTWWMTLAVAVLAIPAFAIMVVLAIQPSGMSEMVIFVLTCWVCTYFGLRMVRSPRIAIPYMLEKISFTEEEKHSRVQAISKAEADMDAWKQQYSKFDAVFMNLAKQPAWTHLDELIQILGRVKQSIAQDSTIAFPELKALNSWVMSSKPATVEGYLQALRTVYPYAKLAFAEQGKDIDSLYPELEKGQLSRFEYAPNNAKAVAWDVLMDTRKKYPFVAAQLNHAAPTTKETPTLTAVA